MVIFESMLILKLAHSWSYETVNMKMFWFLTYTHWVFLEVKIGLIES